MLGVASGGMQFSLDLIILLSSKWHGFPLGGSRSPAVWLRGHQYRRLGGQVYGDRSLEPKLVLGLGFRGMGVTLH